MAETVCFILPFLEAIFYLIAIIGAIFTMFEYCRKQIIEKARKENSLDSTKTIENDLTIEYRKLYFETLRKDYPMVYYVLFGWLRHCIFIVYRRIIDLYKK